MAIWQFYGRVVPQNGIEKFFGYIPENIGDISLLETFWFSYRVDFQVIVGKLDACLPRASYSKSDFLQWKLENETTDHDAYLDINLTTNKIKDFVFRADIRKIPEKQNLLFFFQMCDIMKELHLLLADAKGNIANPSDKEALAVLLFNSNANRFLQNPTEFLKNLPEK